MLETPLFVVFTVILWARLFETMTTGTPCPENTQLKDSGLSTWYFLVYWKLGVIATKE